MWSDGEAWSDRRKWYESEDQYVRRQRELGEQRAEEADARLRTSLREVTEQKNALARQLADLGAAFDAFVELTSVRAELARHVAAATARDQARTLLARLRSSGPVGSPEPQSTATEYTIRDPHAVPGYWLPPAATGLEAMVRGDRRTGDTALEAAAGSDEQRTALFLALALPLAGKPDLAVPWLPRALGPAPSSPGSEVASAVREVWRQAGRGGFGESGQAAAVSWLAGTHCPETVDQLHAMIGKRPASSSSADDLSARLARARAAVAALTELGRRFSAEPPSVGAATASVPKDLVENTATPSLTLLEALIAEGSPAEAELILRAQQLAAEVRRHRTREAAEPSPRWDAPVGTVLALLEADLHGASADHAGLRAIARAALRQTAAGLADRLLAEASPEPPAGLALQLDGQRLEILVDRPLDPQMSELDAVVERRYAPEPGRSFRKRAAEAAQRVDERKARNRSDAQAAIDRFTGLRDQLPEIRQAAQQEYTAVLARLGQLAEHEYVP